MFLLNSQIPHSPVLHSRANPSPEVTDPFCRIPLPTFVHSPEVLPLEPCCGLGTVTLYRIAFSRTTQCNRHINGNAVFNRCASLDNPSAHRSIYKSRCLSTAHCVTSPIHLRCRLITWPRNFSLVLFRSRLLLLLAPAELQLVAIAADPCSSSVFGTLFRIVATTTKICTAGRSMHGYPHTSAQPARPPTRGWASVRRYSAIHFQNS